MPATKQTIDVPPSYAARTRTATDRWSHGPLNPFASFHLCNVKYEWFDVAGDHVGRLIG